MIETLLIAVKMLCKIKEKLLCFSLVYQFINTYIPIILRCIKCMFSLLLGTALLLINEQPYMSIT